jgi:anti-sigma B factor antagonist
MTGPKPLGVKVETTNTSVVVALSGEIDLAVAGQLTERLENIEPPPGGPLVIDLTGVDFIDSSGLRVLVLTNHRAQRDGFRLVLVRGPEAVSRVLQLTRLDEQLEIVDSRDAVAAG